MCDALHFYFYENSRERLEKDLEKGVDKRFKAKNEDLTDLAVTQGAELKHSLQSLTATPRYVLSYAESKYRSATTEPIQRSSILVRHDIAATADPNVLEVWRSTVHEDFDAVWRCAIESRKDRKAQKKVKGVKDEDGEVETDETKDWRTYTVTVKQVLREELSNEDYHRILRLLDEGQV